MGPREALGADLAPERPGVLAPLSHALLQMSEVGVKARRIGSAPRALREALGLSVFAYRCTRQTRRAPDGQQRLAGEMTPAHVLVGCKPASAAVAADGDLGRAAAIGARAFPRLPAVTTRKDGKLSQPAVSTAKPAFEGLAHVEEEVPPIGDLESGGGARRGCSGVLGRAVAGDDLDTRMATQPRGDGHRRAVGQQVDRASAFEVNEEGAVGPSLADGPIVDADGSWWSRTRQREAVQEAQHRIGAGPHPQVAGQARTGLRAGCKPNPCLGLSEAACPSGSWRHQPWERLGEGAAVAGGMTAVEASDAQAQRHGLAEARQIGGTAIVAAVNGGTGRATGGTSSLSAAHMGEDDEVIGAPGDALDGAARQG
ncbi:hypothetical protein GMJLKIPL_6635 [Methylobacterium isbiliense]|uniref:Uncharacterized protein n=1 Tax=Methylobacterium isbiliense TaxID=315478 RepID=A0ABQ4SSM6_9HYPH|nr:hypothetical protein GMJLKIPL_6635 [Methylobacterium isbiliense]